jgi:hypothetical protein
MSSWSMPHDQHPHWMPQMAACGVLKRDNEFLDRFVPLGHRLAPTRSSAELVTGGLDVGHMTKAQAS